MKYDLTVAYRIYPLISKVPAIFPDDKFKMSEICIKSFAKAIGNLKVKMFVILDNCPETYTQLFIDNLKNVDLEFINENGVGNGNTFGIQLDLLTRAETDFVYFAEDDYFYLNNSISDLIEFASLNNIDYATPYDHLDYYNHKLHKKSKENFKTFNGKQYYFQYTTTMTFLAKRSTLLEDINVFRTYTNNNWDNSMWLVLTSNILINPIKFFRLAFFDSQMFKMYIKSIVHTSKFLFKSPKRSLWVAKPGTATHLDNKFLSPSIDWQKEFNKFL